MARIIDGKLISKQIKEELRERAAEYRAQGTEICLAVIQVGNDPASSVYVGNKKKACEYIGIKSLAYELPEETRESELLELIGELNGRKDVNGILVQLPLPGHIDEDKVIRAIDPLKGCGRLPPPERRGPQHRAEGLYILHSCGNNRASQKKRDRDSGKGMRCCGAQQYRRQAHGNAAPQGKRHRHSVPLQNRRP